MNIFEKLSAITAELNAVAKNLRVGEGRSSYKAVGEADVLAAVKPLEAKHGVYSYPCARRIVDSDIITTKKEYNGTVTETSKYFLRIETDYRFVNVEKPDEFIIVTTYGDGVDSNDKAPGKAMTYGDKYALLKAYKVITGDDPDQTASEDARVERSAGPKFKRADTIPQESDPKETYICEDCGKVIEAFTAPNGKLWSVEKTVKHSREKYNGDTLCPSCMEARTNAVTD